MQFCAPLAADAGNAAEPWYLSRLAMSGFHVSVRSMDYCLFISC